MIFFKKEYTPNIIMDSVNEKIVQRWCDSHNVMINVDSDLSTYWTGFSNMYGQLNGLSYIEAGSFGYMVSTFLTGRGVSCGTDLYFREEDIEYHLLGVLDQLRKEFDDEEEIAKELFSAIFDLYRNDVEKYSFKIHHLTFRLSQSDYDRFMCVDGKDKVSKLRTLVRVYYDSLRD